MSWKSFILLHEKLEKLPSSQISYISGSHYGGIDRNFAAPLFPVPSPQSLMVEF